MPVPLVNNTTQPSCFYLDRLQRFHPGPLSVEYIVNVTLNALLAVAAVLGNAVILHALKKSAALRPPSRALLYSLAASDLGVGLFVQPSYVVYKTAELMNNYRLYCVFGIGFHLSANVFSAVSFLTITAIALDRLMAIHLGASYQSTVSLQRVMIAIVAIWVLTGLWVFTWITDIKIYGLFNISAVSVCLVVSSCSYIWLWYRLHKLKQATKLWKMEAADPSARGAPKLRGHKRSVINMFYVYMLLLICYVPYLCMFFVIHTAKPNPTIIAVLSYTITLLFANSALNPFLYCWRIKEVRKEVLSMLAKLSCQR